MTFQALGTPLTPLRRLFSRRSIRTARGERPGLSGLLPWRSYTHTNAANERLPWSIGGEAMRLWLVNRTGAGWRAATYSILTDRAIGLIALALIIVASLPWSYGMIADSNGRLALVLVDFTALSGGLGFLLLGHLPWPWLKTWRPTKHVHACSVIVPQDLFNRRSGPKIAVLSLSIHVLAVGIACCAVRSISAPANFEQVFMLIPPIMLITMMPISIAGHGLR